MAPRKIGCPAECLTAKQKRHTPVCRSGHKSAWRNIRSLEATKSPRPCEGHAGRLGADSGYRRQPEHRSVRAVLRHFIPNRGLPPLRLRRLVRNALEPFLNGTCTKLVLGPIANVRSAPTGHDLKAFSRNIMHRGKITPPATFPSVMASMQTKARTDQPPRAK